MPVWVSNAQDCALYEEREIATVDWLERLAGSERVRSAVPHHRCEASSVIEAKERGSIRLAIKHVADRSVSYILDADFVGFL
jgi:hypothetical protein